MKVGITSIKDGCTLEGMERECVAAYSSLAKRNERSSQGIHALEDQERLGVRRNKGLPALPGRRPL